MKNAEPNLNLVSWWKSPEPEYVYIYINSWGRWIIPNQLLLGVDESFRTKNPLCVSKGQNSNDWYLIYIVSEIYN
jgi:hypothetical protein